MKRSYWKNTDGLSHCCWSVLPAGALWPSWRQQWLVFEGNKQKTHGLSWLTAQNLQRVFQLLLLSSQPLRPKCYSRHHKITALEMVLNSLQRGEQTSLELPKHWTEGNLHWSRDSKKIFILYSGFGAIHHILAFWATCKIETTIVFQTMWSSDSSFLFTNKFKGSSHIVASRTKNSRITLL